MNSRSTLGTSSGQRFCDVPSLQFHCFLGKWCFPTARTSLSEPKFGRTLRSGLESKAEEEEEEEEEEVLAAAAKNQADFNNSSSATNNIQNTVVKC
jgi:hypothetical protein